MNFIIIFGHRQVAVFVLWCYGSKFLPTIVTVLLWQWVSLFVLCTTYATPGTECFYVYPNVTSEFAWGGWGLKPDMLVVIQNIALVIIVLHFGEWILFFWWSLDWFSSWRLFLVFSDYISKFRPSWVFLLAKDAFQQLDLVFNVLYSVSTQYSFGCRFVMQMFVIYVFYLSHTGYACK